MTDSFWAGSAAAYADAQHQQFEPRLKDLCKRHDEAENTQRAELATEIERIETEYNAKLDSIDDCLF